MKYVEFEKILSPQRLRRYLQAVDGDTRKAMTLYRFNLRLSQELFTIISCFEVALRNAIDAKLSVTLGSDWLRDSVLTGGIFATSGTAKSRDIILKAYNKLNVEGLYSHSKLLSSLDFGVWKYMYSPMQFALTGRILLSIFPYKTRSSRQMQYNHSYVFNELDKINTLRNRIAHHEPVCFMSNQATVYTNYIANEYQKIQTLFMWMGIDSKAMLYGIDHVQTVCKDIDKLLK